MRLKVAYVMNYKTGVLLLLAICLFRILGVGLHSASAKKLIPGALYSLGGLQTRKTPLLYTTFGQESAERGRLADF